MDDNKKIKIPNIEGLTEEEGKKKLKELGIKYKEDIEYKYSFQERGKIIKTNPAKGEYYVGKEVSIYESKGFIFLLLPLIGGMLLLGLLGTAILPQIIEKPRDEKQEEKMQNKEVDEKEIDEQQRLIIEEEKRKEIIERERIERQQEIVRQLEVSRIISENEKKLLEIIEKLQKEIEIQIEKEKETIIIEKEKEKEEEENIDWDIPRISIEDIPNKFTYGDAYELPSWYDFGNDKG